MAGWSEMARDEEQAEILREFGPDELPALTDENLRWNIARATKAEHELAELRRRMREFFGIRELLS